MSVTVRPYRGRKGPWEVDIRLARPDGSVFRERRKAPVSTKNQALRWGRAQEEELLRRDPDDSNKEVPTLSEFKERFLEDYAVANRQKPSGIAAKKTILRAHLEALLGDKKLNEISDHEGGGTC